jgi:dTDP-4-amino-4,6-dideoxygalactose transaminase
LEEFTPYLEQIWESRQLTNGGKFHHELEAALQKFLGVEHISLVANGTLGLLLAIKACKLQGEVITTPYSFVATSHALMWNGITPVFVDICPSTLNLDPERIERAITPKTSGILATHVYGTPCDVDAIEDIAKHRGLKVIYDAAHAFGVSCHCGSILKHGDYSVLSFHATKVFNTFEGGAIISPTAEAKRTIDQLKNFGYVDEITVDAIGINAKMSEFNASLGLLQLDYFDQAIQKRKEIDHTYRKRLDGVKGVRCLNDPSAAASNYTYFPILIDDKYYLDRDELYEKMKLHGVHPRRYFYPLISEFPMYRGLDSAHRDNLPVATHAASQVLCLPIYPDLPLHKVEEICNFIRVQ